MFNIIIKENPVFIKFFTVGDLLMTILGEFLKNDRTESLFAIHVMMSHTRNINSYK